MAMRDFTLEFRACHDDGTTQAILTCASVGDPVVIAFLSGPLASVPGVVNRWMDLVTEAFEADLKACGASILSADRN